ncbi:MAG: carbohydrate kinase [candidate division Zixibacteria bacterium]|nr:carbohydrate kinase [candidate division Zixibacteria bacterium]
MSASCLAFGEILFDCFEDSARLGGAPLNFAWNLRQFGVRVGMVSAVGRDDPGAEALRFLHEKDIDTSFVRVVEAPTGTVTVRLLAGEPQFTIHDDVAWDQIETPVLAEPPDMVYFGTVAQRTEDNRTALRRLLDVPSLHRFFDVNLRQHYYTETILLDGLQAATIVKCNETEWETLRQITGADTPSDLLRRYDIRVFALTRGAAGAALYTADGMTAVSVPTVPVVDAVGAGDAFSATLAAGVLAGVTPERIVTVACAAGAAVVRQAGAHVLLPADVIGAFA